MKSSHGYAGTLARGGAVVALGAGLTVGASGCSNGVEGAFSGAGIGAIAGLIAGSVLGEPGAGAAIGAAIGGASGAVIGDQNERADQRAMYGTNVYIHRVEDPFEPRYQEYDGRYQYRTRAEERCREDADCR